MKRIYYILSILFFLALSITSCNDDEFLEENPTTLYTTEDAYNTQSQVDALVTNMYVHIRYWIQIDNFMKGLGTDMWDTPYWRCSGSGYSNYSLWSSEYSTVYSNWDAFYMLSTYANETLEGCEAETVTWDSEDSKNYDIAQAKFFRGYAYLTLGELYGGVPIVTQFYSNAKYDFTRSTREETYEQAISDLKAAVTGMPDYPSEAGRVAKGVAYHYLSEAYLALAIDQDENTDYLNTSVAYADSVIALHPLMTERFGSRATEGEGETMNDIDAYYADGDVYFDLFQRGNLDYEEGNTEALWTIQNDYDVYFTYGNQNYLPYPRNFSPVFRDITWNSEYSANNTQSSPWKNLVDAYEGGKGVSFVAPTSYAQETIWDNEDNDPTDIRNNELNMRRTFVCKVADSPNYGETVTRDMLSETTLERLYPICTKLAPIDDWGYEGLEDGEARSNMYRDEYACRSAESYLLRAEANLRLGYTSKAADDINVLRNRAQCTNLVEATDVDLDLILDERARELYGEERRWCTLLRMGGTVAVDRINQYSYYAGSDNFADIDESWVDNIFQGSSAQASGWNLFPIPQDVIDANTEATLEQNPGWE